MNSNDTKINSLENLVLIKLLSSSIQYSIAFKPNSMGMDVYKLSMSHEYNVASYSIFLGNFLIKSQSSFIYVVNFETIGVRIFQ